MARVARAFRASGSRALAKRADALDSCSCAWGVLAPLARPELSRAFAYHCRDRLCPIDSGRRCGKLSRRLVPMMDDARKRDRHAVRFITLTQSSDESETPRQARQYLARAFGRLRRTTWWRAHVRGFMAHYEETYSENRGKDGTAAGWHSHVHIIADSEWMAQGELSDAWFRASWGRGLIVDIRAARKGSERELLKYATKAAALPEERIVEYALTMRNARDIVTGGTWHGCDANLDDDEPEPLPADAGEVVRLPLPVVEARAAEGDPWARAVVAAIVRQAVELRRALAARGDTDAEEEGPPETLA